MEWFLNEPEWMAQLPHFQMDALDEVFAGFRGDTARFILLAPASYGTLNLFRANLTRHELVGTRSLIDMGAEYRTYVSRRIEQSRLTLVCPGADGREE